MSLSADQPEVTSSATASRVAPALAYSREACASPPCGPGEMPTGCTDTIATG